MSVNTSVVRISKSLDVRLDKLAARTGRKKSYFASRAIESYLEEVEDYLKGLKALEETNKRYTLAAAAKRLGLDR
jgi:predicted DNA-binding protein